MIKSVMQGDTPIRAQRTYKTMYGTFRHILKHQGPRAFFRGFVPCFLRAAPVNAATFLGFEMTHKYLNKMGL
jgi:solute carrier family 25 carnitine/acylcarnitine transporter 20/29